MAHVKQKWTNASSPSDVIAFITDKSTTIGSAQRADVEEAIALNSGVKILQHFLGAIDFRILFICCVYPRRVHDSTFKHAQAVASVIVNKRVTTSSLKLLSLSSMGVVSASAVTHCKPVHEKKAPFKRRSKPKKNHCLERTLKGVIKTLSTNGKVLRSAPTG